MDKGLPLLVLLTMSATGSAVQPLPPTTPEHPSEIDELGRAVRDHVARLEASATIAERGEQVAQWFNWPNRCVQGYWRNC
jgi:hypothetical protein